MRDGEQQDRRGPHGGNNQVGILKAQVITADHQYGKDASEAADCGDESFSMAG